MPSSGRRPPALLPAAAARLAGFAALALLGAVQWQRLVVSLTWGDALLWVLVAVLGAVGILWADALSRFRGTATLLVALAALVGAYATSGLELALLKPRRIDELGAGLSHGAEALANVQMPYGSADPWPAVTLQLLGAFLCVLAGLLAFWPRTQRTSSAGTGEVARGYQFLSLALLLVLVASPVVSMGGTQPVLLGVGLTALTVLLPLARAAAAQARPRDRGDAGAGRCGRAAARLGRRQGGAVVRLPRLRRGARPRRAAAFDWGHSYGPIDLAARRRRGPARRDAAASYWKVADLDDFDGEAWVDSERDRPGIAEDERRPRRAAGRAARPGARRCA